MIKQEIKQIKKHNSIQEKGITLIALVVTIIVLLILAGISVSIVLRKDGIFNGAEQARDKYTEAKARETLEIAFGALQAEKYKRGLTPKALDARITEEINKMEGEEIGDDKKEVIVDGYRFQIDRTVPKIIGDTLGKANGVIISATVSGNNGWFKQGETANITVTGIIKTYSGGTITKATVTKDGATEDLTLIDGRYTISNITKTTEITIHAEDSKKEQNDKKLTVEAKIDATAPTVESITAIAKGNKITIGAKAIDNESGLKQITYIVEPATIKEGATGTLTLEEEKTITATTSGNYTITFIAEDIVGNKSKGQTKTVEILGTLKHIKTTQGLEEVNTVDVYGATVIGYTCDRKKDDGSELEWQIYYIDEEDDNRVYLISKDFVAPPITRYTTPLLKGDSAEFSKGYRFCTESNKELLGKFSGAMPNNDFTKKFLSEYKDSNATRANLQATKYMLEQEVWAEYKGEKADYAFGGPTIPLFKASYNDICNVTMKLDYKVKNDGYVGSIGGGEYIRFQNLLGNIETQQGIYFKGSGTGEAYGMWLASPVGEADVEYGEGLAHASYKGCMSNLGYLYLYKSILGFRPIVSLKTNVQFTENGGAYSITN